jgi:hypothetical protein
MILGLRLQFSHGPAHKATISIYKSYNLQRDWVFESKVFSQLENA